MAGRHYQGQTGNLSMDGALPHCPGLAVPGVAVPQVNDRGVLTLQLDRRNRRDAVKIPCRVAHVTAASVGVQIALAQLGYAQRERFELLFGAAD